MTYPDFKPELIKRQQFRLRVVSLIVAVMAVAVAGCGLSQSEQIHQAQKSLSNGHLHDAKIRLKSVLRDHEKNGRAWAMLGKISLRQQHYASALYQFRQAGDYGRDREHYALELARAMIGQQKYGKAVKVLAGFKPSSRQERLQKTLLRGKALLAANHLQKADKAYAKALDIKAENVTALVGRTKVELARGRIQPARDFLKRAIAAHPDSALVLAWLGRLDYKQNHCRAAQPRFKKALNASAEKLDFRTEFRVRFMLAQCQFQTHHLRQARENTARLLNAKPNSPGANYLQALIDVQHQDYNAATNHLQTVLRYKPDSQAARLLLASIKLVQNDTGSAHLYLRQVLAQSPENARAIGLQARIFLENEQPQRAVSLVERAYKDKPDSEKLRALLAQTMASAGMPNGAIDKHLSSLPNEAALRLDLARALVSLGRVEAGRRMLHDVHPTTRSTRLKKRVIDLQLDLVANDEIAAIEKARKLAHQAPHNARVLSIVARVQTAHGRPKSAYETLRRALKIEPDNHDLALRTAMLGLQLGHFNAAHDRLKAILKANPGNTAAMLAMARLFKATHQTHRRRGWLEQAHRTHPDSTSISRALVQARIADGAPEKAAQLADRMVSQHPTDSSLLWLAGRAALAAGQVKHGLEQLEKAVTAASSRNQPVYTLKLALAEMTHDRAKKATVRLKNLQSEYPEATVVDRLLVNAQVRNGNISAALATARNLFQGQKHRAALSHTFVGNTLFSVKRYAAASRAYAKAYSNLPARALALRWFNAKRRAGMNDPAKPLRIWLSDNKHGVGVRLRLALWLANQKHYVSARQAYRKVLAHDPENPMALNNLALLVLEQDPKTALELARRAYKAKPQSSAIQDTLGWVLAQNGRFDKARTYLEKAVDQKSPSARMRYHYAYVLANGSVPADKRHARRIVGRLLQESAGGELELQLAQLQSQLSNNARVNVSKPKQTANCFDHKPRFQPALFRKDHRNSCRLSGAGYVVSNRESANRRQGVSNVEWLMAADSIVA